MDSRHHAGSSSRQNTTSRVIAIAKITSQPIVDISNPLTFSEGDHITVIRSLGEGLYEGIIHGHSGCFMAKDVIFYNGKM